MVIILEWRIQKVNCCKHMTMELPSCLNNKMLMLDKLMPSMSGY
jgi:hypothetical protein